MKAQSFATERRWKTLRVAGPEPQYKSCQGRKITQLTQDISAVFWKFPSFFCFSKNNWPFCSVIFLHFQWTKSLSKSKNFIDQKSRLFLDSIEIIYEMQKLLESTQEIKSFDCGNVVDSMCYPRNWSSRFLPLSRWSRSKRRPQSLQRHYRRIRGKGRVEVMGHFSKRRRTYMAWGKGEGRKKNISPNVQKFYRVSRIPIIVEFYKWIVI